MIHKNFKNIVEEYIELNMDKNSYVEDNKLVTMVGVAVEEFRDFLEENKISDEIAGEIYVNYMEEKYPDYEESGDMSLDTGGFFQDYIKISIKDSDLGCLPSNDEISVRKNPKVLHGFCVDEKERERGL